MIDCRHTCTRCGCHPGRRCWDDTTGDPCEVVAGLCSVCRDHDAQPAPVRIQRKRTKGWRKPAGVVDVGRPGKWGNPFSAMDARRRYPSLTSDQVSAFIVNQFRHDLRATHPDYPSDDEIRRELAGKDLMCWCRLGDPCHADVLLSIANTAPEEGPVDADR